MKGLLSIIILGLIIFSSFGVSGLLLKNPFLSSGISEYDMVIIAPYIFSDTLQPLIDHKNLVGIQTFLKTTEEIYDEYIGRDKVEQIKYFIYESVENLDIEYVLLIGDIDILPLRKSAVTLHIQMQTYCNYPTDLYYADIYDETGNFSSWDTNGDDVFGECILTVQDSIETEIIDVVDLYPDIGIGRLPCRSIKDVEIVVDKIIEYETKTYGDEWFQRMVLIGGDTFPENNIIDGENNLDDYIVPEMEKYGFDFVKLYASENKFNKESINQAITCGAGFVSIASHGFPCLIYTFPPFQSSRLFQLRYFSKDIKGMNNGYKLPIFFFESCLVGKFSYTFIDLIGILNLNKLLPLKYFLESLQIKKFPCFAWSVVKKQSGGGIAAIAASQSSWGDYDPGQEFGSVMFHRYFLGAYESGISLGEMMMRTQRKYIELFSWDRITIDEFNLIGDPSLKIGGYPS